MVELLLLAPEDCVEGVSDALMNELEALSVSVEDADADSAAEQALFGEPGMPAPRPGWRRSVLRALFADEALATDAATLLLAQEWAQGIHVQAIAPVEDQDWVRLTQSQFQPVAITPAFWIVPSWHEPPAGAKRVIRLDPGLAFGTGTHPTTRMCLRWTAQHAAARASHWTRVLDYGCGSGILAIAAAKLGAGDVAGTDIDPQALDAAADNARANGTAVAFAAPDAIRGGTFDLVVANILTNPLRMLAPALAARVRPGGRLALAGLLDAQAPLVADAYARWFTIAPWRSADGWTLLAGVRTPDASS